MGCRRHQSGSGSPAGTAGFAVGVFALFIVLSAITLQRRLIVACAVVGAWASGRRQGKLWTCVAFIGRLDMDVQRFARYRRKTRNERLS